MFRNLERFGVSVCSQKTHDLITGKDTQQQDEVLLRRFTCDGPFRGKMFHLCRHAAATITIATEVASFREFVKTRECMLWRPSGSALGIKKFRA